MKVRIGLKKALLIVLFFLFLGTQVTAEEPFLFLSSLKPGMKGQGLTVFSGTKVEAFPVEIVGILEGSGSVSHLILIKLTGGQTVAAGMSGSPIFVGGKLIGAIGYGFQNTDSRFAIVTPIEEMLSLWSRKEGETFSFIEGSLPEDHDGVVLGEAPSGGTWLRAFPVSTPLFLSGYGPRAGNYLLTILQKQGAFSVKQGRGAAYPGLVPTLLPLAIAGKNYKLSSVDQVLQPGSALTLTLVEGDYAVTALGTLTWREGKEFLGFGHSFMNKGWVEYGVGSAEIVSVIDNKEFPFKLGVASSCIGRIIQDRTAGVSGEIGVLPQMVQVSTEVTDEATGFTQDYAFNVVNDEDLLPGLVLAGVIDTIDRTLDRIGPGTASVYFEISGANFPLFQRENLFYGSDVAAAALQEVGEILRVITGNEFVYPELTGVNVRVSINPQRLDAKITKVELPKKEFVPGELVTITAHLLPFRGEEVQTTLEVKLPEIPGKWLLMVYGNDYIFAAEEQGNADEELYSPELYQSYTSLEEKLEEYRTRLQNNQLVAEFLPAEGIPETSEFPEEALLTETLEEETAADGEEDPDASLEHTYSTINTPYFVVGEEQILVEVLPPAGEETPEVPSFELDEYNEFFGF